MVKILITGSNGQLGMELCHLLNEAKIDYLGVNSQELDITDKKKVNQLFETYQPDVVYDCAAYTAVDAAEEEPGKLLNWQVNVDGTRNLAEASEKLAAKLVYISTDYVFDGTKQEMYSEQDRPNPKNEYGRAKLEGEKVVQQIVSSYYIVRTSWVFGKYGKNFVYTMMRLAQSHSELSVVDDQVGRPTWTRTLAEFMIFLVQEQANFGLYQLSNEGQCSWYEFACEILKTTDTVVKPVSSTQFPQKAYRPKHSVMSLSKSAKLGFKNLTWQNALRDFQSVADIDTIN
ncbi:dTDP-4-dehydrorhamnose reductase [Levilactobacillus acidifarinae]|uniref:dTDP-4-dehydrorhamnose reductase n=1 Tax=Levilactobacillus acidifarinae DSM 19394 = JCM 15949 TaxID=1423715 RepID=A0A0R1LQK0_9LACO|nr:dTDP-4-dehydrorhamnose reductase [Levilactobacillus acidifarinae]KRK95137.1 dTDP-4-dehydrorhamnose reductase [Levilactobacillus acidifarinae DSM 19394]GEO70636.1 NAD(P)-dependent oxidoreductase [Levilactobacillus acidifarinae]